MATRGFVPDQKTMDDFRHRSRLNLLDHILKDMELLILCTPTGDVRNHLTEVNIQLMMIEVLMK
jgi:hypothetical protein